MVEMDDREFIFYVAKRMIARLKMLQGAVIEKMYASALRDLDVIENHLKLLRQSLAREQEREAKSFEPKAVQIGKKVVEGKK